MLVSVFWFTQARASKVAKLGYLSDYTSFEWDELNLSGFNECYDKLPEKSNWVLRNSTSKDIGVDLIIWQFLSGKLYSIETNSMNYTDISSSNPEDTHGGRKIPSASLLFQRFCHWHSNYRESIHQLTPYRPIFADHYIPRHLLEQIAEYSENLADKFIPQALQYASALIHDAHHLLYKLHTWLHHCIVAIEHWLGWK